MDMSNSPETAKQPEGDARYVVTVDIIPPKARDGVAIAQELLKDFGTVTEAMKLANGSLRLTVVTVDKRNEWDVVADIAQAVLTQLHMTFVRIRPVSEATNG